MLYILRICVFHAWTLNERGEKREKERGWGGGGGVVYGAFHRLLFLLELLHDSVAVVFYVRVFN